MLIRDSVEAGYVVRFTDITDGNAILRHHARERVIWEIGCWARSEPEAVSAFAPQASHSAGQRFLTANLQRVVGSRERHVVFRPIAS
jgi:hypothetical protein